MINFFSRKKGAIQGGADKRVHARVDFFQSSFCLRAEEEAGSNAQECLFKNISVGGVLFETKAMLDRGDMVRLLYRIGPHFRNDTVRVVRGQKSFDVFNYGCAFVDDDPHRTSMVAEVLH